jgi:glycosyltransferase involved in cell wall biosynthesis
MDSGSECQAGGVLRILHLRDSERLCGPGKIIRDCIRANPDPAITFRMAAFGSSDRNGLLLAFSRLVPVHGLPARRRDLWRAASAVERILRDERIDLLHAHDFKANVVGLAAARRTGIPIVSTAHGKIPISVKARLYCAMDGRLLRRMDLVFAVSAMMARQLYGEGVPGDRLVLARNGIMLPEHPFGYRSDALRREGILRDGEIAIGHVGRVSPEKGVVPLVKSFARIVAAYPAAKLVIAGDGPDIERARHAAEERSLNGRVVFLGYREDIGTLYGALDLFVLNSTTEGLPNAVLEAMAFGVPVIATAVGGTPEVVHDGDTGLLIPPSQPAALVQAIRAVLDDRAAAAERARRARTLVEREFDMARLSQSINASYRRVLAARGKA